MDCVDPKLPSYCECFAHNEARAIYDAFRKNVAEEMQAFRRSGATQEQVRTR